MSRKDDILTAVDNLITVHDEWEADLQAPIVPTERFEYAIEDAIRVCNAGDTPEVCRELVDVVSRLSLEWEEYKAGNMTPDHRPVGSFWGAFRAMNLAREGATPFVPKRPEPVRLLLEQKVSRRQIALHIYGDGKTGPLVNESGQPDDAKIDEEAATPGSVVPDNWVHPQQLELMQRHQRELTTRLQSIASRENEGDGIDPATIEELLREGAYPAQVARAKRVDIQEVLIVMHRLVAAGVKVNGTLPNLAAMRSPQEPDLTPEQDAALQPRKSVDASTIEIDDEDEEVEPDAVVGAVSDSVVSDPAAVEALIVELHQQKPELGAGEIAAELREALGEPVSVQKVSAVLRRVKTEAAQAVAT